MIEVVELESKKLEFIETDGKIYTFRDKVDLEEYNMDAKFVKDLVKWIKRMSGLYETISHNLTFQ